jgi:5-methylcytosine-specific restriction endonuclease McrA
MRARLRRARLRDVSGTHTVEEIQNLLNKQKGRCASCGTSFDGKYEVDHIVPISKGGMNDIRNIQLLHVSCNRRKNAKDPLMWARENGRLL